MGEWGATANLASRSVLRDHSRWRSFSCLHGLCRCHVRLVDEVGALARVDRWLLSGIQPTTQDNVTVGDTDATIRHVFLSFHPDRWVHQRSTCGHCDISADGYMWVLTTATALIANDVWIVTRYSALASTLATERRLQWSLDTLVYRDRLEWVQSCIVWHT